MDGDADFALLETNAVAFSWSWDDIRFIVVFSVDDLFETAGAGCYVVDLINNLPEKYKQPRKLKIAVKLLFAHHRKFCKKLSRFLFVKES